MIPPFEQGGNLPPGIYQATWEEVYNRFGTNDHRRKLLAGLKKALRSLKRARVSIVYLNGSFVTAKDMPGDYDVTWEMEGFDARRLDPVFVDFDQHQAAQKAKYGGEFFPVRADDPQKGYLDFFQKEKRTERPKGIVAIDIRRLK